MITINKLKSLNPKTALRKIADVFYSMSLQQETVSGNYVNELVALLDSSFFDEETAAVLGRRCHALSDPVTFSVACRDISALILAALGTNPTDWDALDDSGNLDVSQRKILSHTLVLDRIRSPYNIGAIFRSADAFGVDKILIVEGSASPLHPRAKKTSRGCVDTVLWEFVTDEDVMQFITTSQRPFFALELGGEAVSTFSFPDNGICMVGSEEFGVSPWFLDVARKSCGIVSLEQWGTKGSLNVSVATGILLHQWITT